MMTQLTCGNLLVQPALRKFLAMYWESDFQLEGFGLFAFGDMTWFRLVALNNSAGCVHCSGAVLPPDFWPKPPVPGVTSLRTP